MGVVHQRIAGDAGSLLVRLAEAPVDDQHLAAAVHRALAVLNLHRHVAVDDVGVLPGEAELRQDAVAHRRVGGMAVVGVLRH